MSNVVELDRRYRRRMCMAKAVDAVGVLVDLKKLQGLSRDEQLDVQEAIQIVQRLADKLAEEEAPK